MNIGYAMPRCIMAFGIEAHVDTEQQVIHFEKQPGRILGIKNEYSLG